MVCFSLVVTAVYTERYELRHWQIGTYETGGYGIRFSPPGLVPPELQGFASLKDMIAHSAVNAERHDEGDDDHAENV